MRIIIIFLLIRLLFSCTYILCSISKIPTTTSSATKLSTTCGTICSPKIFCQQYFGVGQQCYPAPNQYDHHHQPPLPSNYTSGVHYQQKNYYQQDNSAQDHYYQNINGGAQGFHQDAQNQNFY